MSRGLGQVPAGQRQPGDGQARDGGRCSRSTFATILSSIRVPTLILHRTGDLVAPVEGARLMAERIPDARLVEFDGHATTSRSPGDFDPVSDEIEEFLTGTRQARPLDRVLATVMFTDIVDSTERAAEPGDRRWRELIERHDELTRRQLDRFRGREVKTLGRRLSRHLRRTRPRDRVRLRDQGRRSGRWAWRCGPGCTPASASSAATTFAGWPSTSAPGWAPLRGAERGAGLEHGQGPRGRRELEFADRGEHELKGVPGTWRLFAAAPG